MPDKKTVSLGDSLAFGFMMLFYGVILGVVGTRLYEVITE